MQSVSQRPTGHSHCSMHDVPGVSFSECVPPIADRARMQKWMPASQRAAPLEGILFTHKGDQSLPSESRLNRLPTTLANTS